MSHNLSLSVLTRKKIALLIVLGLAFITADAVLIIAIKNNLKQRTSLEEQQLTSKVKPGTHLPPFSGQDIYGNRVNLQYGDGGRKTILFVFSPRCPFCTENMPTWKGITGGVDEKSFRTVGVTTLVKGTQEYVAEHGLSRMPILAIPDKEIEDAYHFTRTPQTILINSEGTVERVWLGLIKKEQFQEVEQALDVKLR